MTLRLTARPALVVAGALAATLAAGPALAATPAQHTTLTVTTKSTGVSTTAQPITGKLLTASGKALPKGQWVRLVARMNGATKFQNVRAAQTDGNGVVTFSIKPPKGHDQYALVYNGSHKTTPAYDGSHSRTVTVTVSK